MKYPLHQFSAVEVCITAIYVYCGFFAATVAAEVLAAGSAGQALWVTFAGMVSSAILLRTWLQQQSTRGHVINVVLLATASLIAIEVAAAVAP